MIAEGTTLCGLVDEQIEAYRHYFPRKDDRGCPGCRRLAATAPTLPCGQERLHDLALECPPGPMREELLVALRRGARIRLWIDGPAANMAKFYAPLDRIVEGGPAVVAAIGANQRVGLAMVEHGQWEFVVVLPVNGPPLIARATADLSAPARPSGRDREQR